VSKKVRGSVRTTRPGTRAASARVVGRTRPLSAAVPSPLEEAEIIAEDIVDDRPDEARSELERYSRSTSQRTHHKVKAGSILAARAATEYVYVAQDLRRILLVAGGLVGLLFALWLLLVVMKVIALPFY
jgi:hypothetical protein